MPINTDTEYLDGEFTVSEPEPSTLQEVVDLIGEDAVRSEAVSNLYYRNKYPRVYRKVSEAVEKSGFARPQKIAKDGTPEVKKSKDGTEKKVLVDPTGHLRAYLATGEEAKKSLGELFATIGPAEPLYVKGERTGGGGKVSAGAMELANKKFAAGSTAVESAIEKIEANTPGYKVGRDPEGEATPESLARGIQALGKALAQKAKNEAEAILV